MLVLSRKKDETIILDNKIEVRVLEIKGDQVRLGVVAPKEIKVYRGEIFEAIAEENRQAQYSAGALAALKEILSKDEKM